MQLAPGSPRCTHIHHSVVGLTEPSAPQAMGPHIHTSIHTALHFNTHTQTTERASERENEETSAVLLSNTTTQRPETCT